MGVEQKIPTLDMGTQQSLNKIFTALLACPDNIADKYIAERKYEVYNKCFGLFKSKFGINAFYNEYYFIYQIFTESKVKLFSIEQLRSIIDTNRKDIMETPYIDLNLSKKLDNGGILVPEDKVKIFEQDMISIVSELSNKEVSVVDFESSCEQYLEFYKNELMRNISNNMSMIMSATGMDERLKRNGLKHWQGREDALAYYSKEIANIRALDEQDAVKAIVMDTEYANKQNEIDASGEEDVDALMDYGIEEMDRVCLKLRRTNMIELMGPPKGGKTTYTGYLVERALKKKLNVAVWALEGKYTEWEALVNTLTVAHFDKDSMRLNRGRILNRSFQNDRERQAIAAARTLIASPERGKLSFIEGTAYVEDFLDILKDHFENINAYDVLVIDSPINILSKTGRPKAERISEAYMRLKDFVANKIPGGALCLVTAQLKQDAIDKLRAKPNETIDVTAGGESAETIRTPDEIIGLFSTKLERNNGQMKIYNVGSRHHETFADFFVGCDLGSGDFYSNPELNE